MGSALALVLLLAACQGEPLEKGVAARVNGKPIQLRTLEFVHGTRLYAPPVDPGDALSSLKAEYGEALATLIVEELVTQELARRGLEVTEAELKNAETAARSGYPGKSFEDILAEEGVDPAIWRERLRARVALDKFSARVLRPRIAITPQDVQGYYSAHADEFAKPAAVKFIKLESKNAEPLRKALAEAAKARDPADVLTVFDDVSAQVRVSAVEALPRAWLDALKGLKSGQAGPVSQGGIGFQAFMLLERSEAKVEGLVQVYPLVEKRVSEGKLSGEFTAWLTHALASSLIEVSPGLAPEKR
jgi:hypothetical protein